MNKTELIAHLESRLGSRGAAVAALDAVLTEIKDAVASGDRVVLTGFGTFEPVARAARTGRDPRTGAPLTIAASTTPRFRPGAGLRAAVAGGVTTERPARPAARPAARKAATPAKPVERAKAAVAVKPVKPAKAAKAAVKVAKATKSAKANKPKKAAKAKAAVKLAKAAKSAKANKPKKAAKGK